MSQLSPIDWLMPRAYVRLIFCFASVKTPELVHTTLKQGLAKLLVELPYLACGIDDGDCPRGAPAMTSPCYVVDDLISWHDLSARLEYHLLRQHSFPPSAFDGPSVYPSDTVPPYPKPEPVFRAAVTAASGGGFILSTAFHHCAVDITAIGAVMRLWASYCQHECFDIRDVGFRPSWLDRSTIARSLTSSQAKPTNSPGIPGLLQHVERCRSQVTTSEPRAVDSAVDLRAKPSPTETVVLHFAADALRELKTATNARLELARGPDSPSWVSTGDLITSLLWSALLASKGDVDVDTPTGPCTSTMGIPVEVRSSLGLPDGPVPPVGAQYLGAAFFVTSATVLRSDLRALSSATSAATAAPHLPGIASEVRTSILRLRNGHGDLQSALSFLLSQTDITGMAMKQPADGLFVTSWLAQETCGRHWGDVVGTCEAVRAPKATVPVILPRVPPSLGRDREGVEVIVGGKRDVLDQFRAVPVIRAFARELCSGTPEFPRFSTLNSDV